MIIKHPKSMLTKQNSNIFTINHTVWVMERGLSVTRDLPSRVSAVRDMVKVVLLISKVCSHL